MEPIPEGEIMKIECCDRTKFHVFVDIPELGEYRFLNLWAYSIEHEGKEQMGCHKHNTLRTPPDEVHQKAKLFLAREIKKEKYVHALESYKRCFEPDLGFCFSS